MCSIYGIIYFKSCSKNILEDKMKKMSITTNHRGPDENEIKYFDNAAIGMNRLSIIGPNDKESMVQKNGQFYSVLNGEITNYKELSKEVNIDVQCDSKIILPMYEKYSTNFIKKLGGMFSIALYDDVNKKIMLWRDSLGIKPLYYYINKDYFIFASEIKAIYSAVDKKPEVNYNAIDYILRYGLNPGNTTAFCEIKKVLPGEMISVANGNLKAEKYWNLKNNIEYEGIHKEEQKKTEEFKEIICNIMNENAYSDVPGGFFLSGGLDSSLATSIILQNKNSNYNIPISIRFLPNSVDDEKYVKILEKYFNKKVEWVDITPKKARSTLEELVKFIDEPLANPVHVGTYLMSKRAKELNLKTVITGDGADELFIGYERQACWGKYKNAKEIYPSLSWIISKSDIEALYNKEFLDIIGNRKYIAEGVSNIKDALLYERGERLPEYHNMRLDRMTMAHSIEAKVPFQDYRIAGYSFGFSIKELMRETKKGWLKEFARDWLPDDIIYRKKSIFPSLPSEWISEDGIKWAKNILLDNNSKINMYINKNILERWIEEHSSNKIKRGKELWALITLELWLRNLKNWN